MFVSKKKFAALEAEMRAMRSNHALITQKQSLANADLHVKNKKMELALEFISNQRTASANATVTRMADRADEALGRTKMAEFITEPAKPEGTLADLRRHFFTAPLGTRPATTTRRNDDNFYDIGNVAFLDNTIYSNPTTTSDYSSGSSSYDSGSSCSSDSGSSGGCD